MTLRCFALNITEIKKMKLEMYELEIAADVDKLSKVTEFVDSILEKNGCPIKVQMKIDLALEELFVNIAHYAYPDGEGTAKILAGANSEYVEITFIDSGVPYDPLAKPDPDVTLSIEERQIGGLGIFLSKKLMDDISYKYEDNKNILTVRKNF